VAVLDMPAMSGMIGTVEQSTGTMAVIDFGVLGQWRVEAWRVIPSALLGGDTDR
jgi:hypothetical protein